MTPALASLKAALSARYAVEQELGRGGMAVVYLAEDLRHHRNVAIKVLRPELAATLGAARFLREIEIAAQLTHPHILPLHDSGAADGFLFYVMPYIEGESLRDRLKRDCQLPIADALSLTGEVASALDYAHHQGVIHRDIKPENILLSAGGAVVADFGIARAVTAAGGDQLTEPGMAVGTHAYMSPEQASGEVQVDGRSDVYSLGCVLYEMLGGEPPYTGPTPQAVIAKKLSEPTPRISVLRELVPQSVEGALHRALAKTPADRFDTAANFVDELNATLQGISAPKAAVKRKAPVAAPSPRVSWLMLAGIAGTGIVATAAAALLFMRGGPERTPATTAHLTQVTYSGNAIQAELSPDGEFLAFVEEGEPARLLVKDLTGGTTLEIAAIRRLFTLRWSPDGSSLLVSGRDSAGQRMSVTYPRLGGEPRLVAGCCNVFAAWSPDGSTIAHWGQPVESPLNITAGGVTRSISIPDSAGFHHSGDWSPDGERIALGTRTAQGGRSMIWALEVEREQWHLLIADTVAISAPRWSKDGGAVYYFRGDELRKLRVSEEGVAFAEPELVRAGLEIYSSEPDELLPAPSFTPDGTAFAFVSGRHYTNIRLTTLAGLRADSPSATELTRGTAGKSAARFSPDEEWIAFAQYERGRGDLFVLRSDGSGLRRVTSSGHVVSAPVWSADGQQLAFIASNARTPEIRTVAVATGRERRHEHTRASNHLAWAPMDRILYQRPGNRNFHFLDPTTETEEPLVTNESVGWMFYPQISPDGLKVAVWWNRSPQRGLWVISLADSSQTLLRAGLAYPVGYSPDGKAVYVEEETPDGWRLVMVDLDSGEATVLGPTPYADLYTCETRERAQSTDILCSVSESVSDVWVVEDFDPEPAEPLQ